ncbi:MAG: T9SS type A sorting domain-containing protein [candidate division Zixibacteria bacterium]|nr:T9SS type A sorting domain-containing protein [candidate division Zixibacteria bacterium]
MKYYPKYLIILIVVTIAANTAATIIDIPYDYPTIQQGIDASSDGDTVLVQPGTYVESIHFNGYNIVLGSLFLTTGDTSHISNTIIDANNVYCAIIVDSGEDSTSLITGFSILNGYSRNHLTAAGVTCMNASSPEIRYNIIANSDGHYGGALSCRENSRAYIHDNRIISNMAFQGAGIYTSNAQPIIENNIIRGNDSSAEGGGIICLDGATTIIKGNMISENSGCCGGGICVWYSNPIISYNVIFNNQVSNYGGAINFLHTNCLVTNNTIFGNIAGSGGAIFCHSFGDPVIVNTIFWGDSASSQYDEIYDGGDPAAITYSNIDGGYNGEGNIDADPLFINPYNDDFHLQTGSPCIDTGDPESPLDPDLTRADIGAFYHRRENRVFNIPDDFPAIQEGIDACIDGDTVLVQPGIYVENIDFDGHNIVLASLFLTAGDTNYIEQTVIDGDSSGSVVKFESGELNSTIITGFTLRNGFSDYGGGIRCTGGSVPVIEHNILVDNAASEGGGGAYFEISVASFKRNVVYNNITDGYGGGVLSRFNSSPYITNCTFSDNMASRGGGLCCLETSFPRVKNTIYWNNSASVEGNEIFGNETSRPTMTYSNIEGGWEGEGNIDADPLFVDPDSGDYHLLAGSPCIDTGDPDSPLDPDGTRSDLGAFYSPRTGPRTIDIPAHYPAIQQGIDASFIGDTVLVQPGVYIENINFNEHNLILGSLFLTTGDTSYIPQTIIDGDAAGSVVTFENGEDSSTVITGFTIRNGMGGYSEEHIIGGGITCFNQANPTIVGNIITENNTDESGSGGGILIAFANPTVTNNRIIDNISGLIGGGIAIRFSGSIINSNLISGNSSYIGGGIYTDFPITIINNVIVGNSAFNGGGIICDGSSQMIVNNTISGNYAENFGGGICIAYDADPIVVNTILWADSAESGDEVYTISDSIDITYSDIQGGWEGQGNIDADPLFVDPTSGDYHLLAGSPCIDTGDPESPLDPDSTRADMGAFYFDQHVDIEIIDILPTTFHLYQNYPNPFNASTTISYDIPRSSDVTIEIYDILGRRIETLIFQNQPAGSHSLIWHARDLTSGIYFYRIQAGSYLESRKMLLIK